jgi:3-keto-disaccharide hydrolase
VRPAGEWNRSIFTLRGGKLTVTLNGETVREGAAHEGPPRGRIVLRPTEDVEFANVFVKRY